MLCLDYKHANLILLTAFFIPSQKTLSELLKETNIFKEACGKHLMLKVFWHKLDAVGAYLDTQSCEHLYAILTLCPNSHHSHSPKTIW